MDRRRFLGALGAASLAPAQGAKKTNVVMIMTDDHGAWALGSYGCGEMKTPNLDALAAGGARFTRAYACTPVCSPSRLTWLTGRLPSTHGVQDWLRPVDAFGPKSRKVTAENPTYSDVLARNGYTLGMVGKWHMGHDDTPQAGFTYWATVPGGGGTYRRPEFVGTRKNGVINEFKEDAIGDCALDFLDTVGDKPFYLLMPFYAPHTPLDYQPEKYREPFQEAKFDCYPDTPRHEWQNPGLARLHRNRDSMLGYAALIRAVDENVGRVVKKLEEMGVRDNTLIVFTADQGWNFGHHGVVGKGNGTWPFNMYDESIRVPLIWNHPGKIKPGQVLTPMVSSYDYAPTILDYLGVHMEKDAKSPGHSYAGFLRGDKPEWDNRKYFEYSFVRGVRTERYKYVRRTEEWPSELYDLELDPGEKKNLVSDPAYATLRRSLDTDLDVWFAKYGAPPQSEWKGTVRQLLTVYGR